MYVPLAFRYPLVLGKIGGCSNKSMMLAKFPQMQVVAGENFSQGIFMQLAEMIGLTKGIVSQLPVEIHGDGLITTVYQIAQAIGGQFIRQFSTQ